MKETEREVNQKSIQISVWCIESDTHRSRQMYNGNGGWILTQFPIVNPISLSPTSTDIHHNIIRCRILCILALRFDFFPPPPFPFLFHSASNVSLAIALNFKIAIVLVANENALLPLIMVLTLPMEDEEEEEKY